MPTQLFLVQIVDFPYRRENPDWLINDLKICQILKMEITVFNLQTSAAHSY